MVELSSGQGQGERADVALLADMVAAEAERRGFTGADVAMALLHMEKNGKDGAAVQGSLPGWPTDPDKVYDEVPEGFITLPSAARKYELNRVVLRNWVGRGHLRVFGRLKGPAQGGGFLLLNEDELREHLNQPRPPGRRRHKH